MTWTPEERRKYNRLWYQKNKEKILEQKKLYHQKNKEKINENMKLYYQKNKEKKSEYDKLYRQTPNGKKTYTISSWKTIGLISDDYEAIYERYLNSKNCEECGCEYSIMGDGIGRFRVMDHNHDTGEFRNFLCHICNVRRG